MINNKGFFIFDLLKNYESFEYMLQLLGLCFYGISVCTNMCVSVLMCVSCGFLLTFFLLFVLSYSTIFFSLDACFLNERKNRMDLNERKGQVRRISVELVGGIYKNILYKNICFQ